VRALTRLSTIQVPGSLRICRTIGVQRLLIGARNDDTYGLEFATQSVASIFRISSLIHNLIEVELGVLALDDHRIGDGTLA
jgi:hypothetical protein